MNKKTIKFEIVTPEKKVFEDEVQQITIPTQEGEITVLPNHIPLVSIMDSGVIELKNSQDEIKVMAVSGGFLEVFYDKIVILADSADRAEELDEEICQEARQRAEEELKNTRQFDKERFTNINAVIARELARTKAIQRWRKLK